MRPVYPARHPITRPALLLAGKCWYQANDLPRAHAALSSALTRKFDEAPEASYWLGQTLSKQNKPADALAWIKNMLIAESDFP